MLRIYNTLTKHKEDFTPINPGKVGIYVCGPTVYDYAHIGNWKSFLTADILRRWLEYSGYETRVIENITDVGHLTDDDVAQGDSGEDKIVKKANAEKRTPQEIARFYEESFKKTAKKLNFLPPHYSPRATEHIPHILKMIETLLANGHAYEKNGNVFFDVLSFKNYGKLSGNTLTNLKAGTRIEKHPDKKNPWDFALWIKAPKRHSMQWDSPWSRGYPGWHIECSAMSAEYLGTTFDIHTGGEDHIFPHHEAEIAQSVCAHKMPFVRYWIHTRHVLVDGQKMAKSKKNFYTLEDVLEKGYTAMDLRISLLLSQHTAHMNFTWERMDQAKANRESCEAFSDRLGEYAHKGKTSLSTISYRKSFEDAMNDNLNTPLALSTLQKMITKAHALMDQKDLGNMSSVQSLFSQILSILGITLISHTNKKIPTVILNLSKAREEARRARNFEKADILRKKIEAKGYSVKDGPTGSLLKPL